MVTLRQQEAHGLGQPRATSHHPGRGKGSGMQVPNPVLRYGSEGVARKDRNWKKWSRGVHSVDGKTALPSKKAYEAIGGGTSMVFGQTKRPVANDLARSTVFV